MSFVIMTRCPPTRTQAHFEERREQIEQGMSSKSTATAALQDEITSLRTALRKAKSRAREAESLLERQSQEVEWGADGWGGGDAS